MYSAIRLGTASKATPQGRRLYRAGVGFELAIKWSPARRHDHSATTYFMTQPLNIWLHCYIPSSSAEMQVCKTKCSRSKSWIVLMIVSATHSSLGEFKDQTGPSIDYPCCQTPSNGRPYSSSILWFWNELKTKKPSESAVTGFVGQASIPHMQLEYKCHRMNLIDSLPPGPVTN